MARLRRERVLLLALLAAVVIAWGIVAREIQQELTITVLDVGQGDCILVQAPGGRTVLVDAGGRQGQEVSGWDIGSEVVVPALMARGVGRIDVLVITHPHEDHIGGAAAVLEAVPVDLVLDPMLETNSETYRDLVETIRQHGVSHYRATQGQRLNLGEGIYAEVLNPPESRLSDTGSDLNDNSVVLRLVYDAVSVLLAADIDELGAYRMAWLGEAVDSTILKVPHHGAPDPAVPEFIEAVSPDLAIVSVGYDNPHGHPSDEMLRELERVGSKIMRTDRDGAITARIRPPRWWAVGSSRHARTHAGSARVAPTSAGK